MKTTIGLQEAVNEAGKLGWQAIHYARNPNDSWTVIFESKERDGKPIPAQPGSEPALG